MIDIDIGKAEFHLMALMVAVGQNRWFEERYPNGRFLICKRSLGEAPVKGR